MWERLLRRLERARGAAVGAEDLVLELEAASTVKRYLRPRFARGPRGPRGEAQITTAAATSASVTAAVDALDAAITRIRALRGGR